MKKLTMALFLLTFSTLSFAESTSIDLETSATSNAIPTPPEKPKQAIGFSLGWVVANGLSYRRYYDSKFIQTTFAGAVNKDDDKEYIDFSISFGHYLNPLVFEPGEMPIGFKFITGLEIERDSNRRSDLVSQDPNKKTDELHIGLGFGLEFGNPGKKGTLYSLDLIYTASYRDLGNLEFVRLGLLPSVSIQYNL